MIVRVRRVFYVFEDEVDVREGALELSYANGTKELFNAAGDGVTLRVEQTAWVDPFEGKVDDANQRWVAEYGKLTAFDVSAEEPYVDLIGSQVTRAEEIRNEYGDIVGRVMHASERQIHIEVGGDELHVAIV